MLSINNISVMNFDGAFRGMRNPMNSWNKADSYFDENGSFVAGPNDLDLAKRLRTAGSDHRKYLRQIFVCLDVTAPLYWWKEYDTYKVATVANSTSTMHKIHAKPFEMADFSTDHMDEETLAAFGSVIAYCEKLRQKYLVNKDKQYWYDLIQFLPSSYNQMRTLTLSYETLVNIYFARRNHKLDEWHAFCDMIMSLPYAKELIANETPDEDEG